MAADFALGEGPLWRGAEKALCLVDIDGRAVHSIDWATRQLTSVGYDREVCALVDCDDGSLGVVLDDQISLGGRLIVPGLEPEVRFNDGKVDPTGRLWVGTMDRTGTRPLGALYSLDRDGLILRASGFPISNGLGWSPDGALMYQVDTMRRRILVREMNRLQPGLPPKSIMDLADFEGLPDGMAVDVEGNLWVAFWASGAIRCIDPAGKGVHKFDVPVSDVSSCAFAGPLLDRLVITTARRDHPEEELAGSVFVLDPKVSGVPVARWSSQ